MVCRGKEAKKITKQETEVFEMVQDVQDAKERVLEKLEQSGTRGIVKSKLYGYGVNKDFLDRMIKAGEIVAIKADVGRVCYLPEKYEEAVETQKAAPVAPGETPKVAPKEKSPEMKICKDCGCEFEPWKRGAMMVSRVCKPCLVNKTKVNLASGNQTGVEKFLEKFGLLEQVNRTAAENMRPVDWEVAHIIKQAGV